MTTEFKWLGNLPDSKWCFSYCVGLRKLYSGEIWSNHTQIFSVTQQGNLSHSQFQPHGKLMTAIRSPSLWALLTQALEKQTQKGGRKLSILVSSFSLKTKRLHLFQTSVFKIHFLLCYISKGTNTLWTSSLLK